MITLTNTEKGTKMTDRQKILETAFGSVKDFVKSGERFCGAIGLYGNTAEDMLSEFTCAGLDAAGRVDASRTPKEIKAYIARRARGAVKDYYRDTVKQARVKCPISFQSFDKEFKRSSDAEVKSLHDEVESNRFDTPTAAVLKSEEQNKFAAAIKTIPAAQREVLEATINGMNMVEIAAVRGVSKQAIHKTYTAAIDNMRLAVA